jgi:hypothetical protein
MTFYNLKKKHVKKNATIRTLLSLNSPYPRKE